MSQTKAQMINPREHGQRALNLKAPVFSADAVARAENAIEDLSASFGDWLEDEITKLHEARLGAVAANWSDAATMTLYAASHDLKGLGSTYGSPISTRLAASLCRLLETDAGREHARRDPTLACAHVDAVRATTRGGVKTEDDPMGAALLRELEAQVAALGLPR